MSHKVLNLYAGIGGNRKLWKNVKVTAIEINPKIARIYQNFFPDDKVIITDAHKFLEDNIYEGWDFIWSSPPCQSHSSFRYNIGIKFRNVKPIYPDMRLYEEILFLKYYFNGKWVVENVVPFYKPLLNPKLIQRHLFWSNFFIPNIEFKQDNLREYQIKDLENIYGIDLSKYKISNRRQILRNCVHPKLGEHIFNSAFKIKQEKIV